MISAHDLSRQLGEELSFLVDDIDAPLTDITPLSGGGYPGYVPNAFRLRFSDGRTFKGRRFGNVSRAAAVDYVLQHWVESRLPCENSSGTPLHDAFPKVLARSGRAMLTEWAEGNPLDPTLCTPTLIRDCGALQGQMHTVTVPPNAPFPRRETIASWHARLKTDVENMVAAGTLNGDEGRRSLDWAMRYVPETCETGFVHCDFCPQNIVLGPSGELRVVDNETLAVDAFDYDLARTWYRWRMSPPQREAYFESYSQYRAPRGFLTHFPFWAIVVLVGSAVFRLNKHMSAAAEPIGRLRAFLSSLNNGLKADRAFLDE